MTFAQTIAAKIRDASGVVMRHRWLAIAIFCALMAPALFLISRYPQNYTATANVLIVNGNSRNDPTLGSPDLPSIVGSAAILERVKSNLKISTPLKTMKRHLSARPPAYRSGIMRIQYSDTDKVRAALVVNGVADELARYYGQLSTARYDADLRALDRELSKQKSRLENIDAQLRARGIEYLPTDGKNDDPGSQAASLESQRVIASANLQGDMAQQQAAAIGAQHQLLAGDLQFQQLQFSLAKAMTLLAEARARYTDQYPGLPALQEHVDSLKASLAQERARVLSSGGAMSEDEAKVEASVQADRAKVAALDGELAIENKNLAGASPLELLRVERDDALHEYQSIAARRATSLADRADALSLGSVEVVDRAIPSEVQPGIGPIRLTLIAAWIAALIALGSAFLVDQLDPRLRQSAQIEALYGKPIIATLSTSQRDSLANGSAPNAQAQLLRARVESELNKPAVLMVTSARAGDGKSLTAYTLARSLSRINHRVALVSDRSPDEHHHLAVVEIPGDEGSSHDQLDAFVKKMRSNYDFTVVDAETFDKGTTVLELSRLVDGILVAVRVGRVRSADDEAMVRMLEQFGGNVVGVVATEAHDPDGTEPIKASLKALMAAKRGSG